MITTNFAPGTPCWIDLAVPGVDAAARFYSSVFYWEFESLGPNWGGYGFFRLDDKIVAAAGPLDEAGARSAWTIYFKVNDVETAVRDAENAGGTVRTAPMDVGEEGRLAQLADPLGGRFALWQPGRLEGLGVTDKAGSLCWIELYTTDSAASKRFYGELFGWETQDVELSGGSGTYSMIGPSGADREHMMGGIMELPAENLAAAGGRPYWHPVFEVADCDATVTRVTGNGGSVVMGPEDVAGVGRLAVCIDPAGVDFVVLTPKPD